MKTLYFIRHAKSDWSIEQLQDIDRPLNARGYNDAHMMSLRLKAKKVIPDLIIASPAIRAITTAFIFCRTFEYPESKVQIQKSLYESSLSDYLNCIQHIENKHKTVLLFGHNPTITACANTFTTSAIEEIPTCGIAAIKIKTISWNKLSAENTELLLYDFPKSES